MESKERLAQKECNVTTSAYAVQTAQFQSESGEKVQVKTGEEFVGEEVKLVLTRKFSQQAPEEESEGGGDADLFYTTCPLCVPGEGEEEKKEDVGRGGGGCALPKEEDKNKRGVIQPRMAVPIWATL